MREPASMESPSQSEPSASEKAEYSQPPLRETRPPAASFSRPEHRPGGFGQSRHDQGRRRGGRWRQGHGGQRHQGRELPPSKYASPRPYSPPGGQPSQEVPTDYEPVILPGESLAKYKDRMPPASGPGSIGASAPASPVEAPPPSEAQEYPGIAADDEQELSSSNSGKHESEESTPEEGWRAAGETPGHSGAQEPDSRTFAEYQALPEEPPRAIYEAVPPEGSAAHATHQDLSEEEVTSLAEQLAEARHEEVSAKAEADAELHLLEEEPPHAPESGAEADEFIAEAEEAEEEEHDEMSTGLAPETIAGMHEPEISEAASAPERPMTARISEPQRARFQRPMRRGGRRGQRPVRRPDHRHEPRRPQLISEVLKAGQEIIVQIAKEPLGKKGARITSHVALPGRFLVYMPTVNHIGVSRRINSAEERSRLRHLVTEAKGTFPGGFIVRTAADGAPDEEIRADVEFLGRTWEKIRTQSEPRKSPALLHRDLNLVERILRDYVNNDYTAIWIDNEDEFSKVVEFVSRFQPKLVGRVKLYTKTSPIFEEFGIQQELDKALRPKVWLKSGGYIVINHTEALVAIDVNTGKYVGRGSTRLEDTIVKTNLEAVKEIIRQIRLRDLGGIIVLDFIDMEERRNRDKVMAALEAALRSDRAPSKALAFN
jgi:ribonuclease G